MVVSPDCRDENHGKCNGVAWDLEQDAPTACECACGFTVSGDKTTRAKANPPMFFAPAGIADRRAHV